jgi:hypothetical protein
MLPIALHIPIAARNGKHHSRIAARTDPLSGAEPGAPSRISHPTLFLSQPSRITTSLTDTTTTRRLYSQPADSHPHPPDTTPPHIHEPLPSSRMSIENLKTFDPFAEADEDTGQVKQSQQDYIHIRIQRTYSPYTYMPGSLRLRCCRITCKTPLTAAPHYPRGNRRSAPLLYTPLTSRRAQWPQDPNHGPRTAQEIRPEEDPQGDQEEVCL